MTLIGILLRASYLIRRHHWSGAPLDRWLALLLVLIAGLIAIRWLPGGITGVGVCAVLLLLLLLFQGWAGRRNHIIFRREAPAADPRPGGGMMAPQDKLKLRATGIFEVEGKEQTFTELLAYFRSFETREHAVMAVVPPSSLLGVGNWPLDEVGMWYMFFKNTDLRRIEPGSLCFGSRRRPALRLAIEQEVPPEASPLDVWGGYRSGKPGRNPKRVRRTIYLSFDSFEDRERVVADLTADATRLLPCHPN